VADYRKLLEDSLRSWGELSESTLRSHKLILCEDAFLRAAVGWESFRSDWHIAAINRDGTRFREDLKVTIDRLLDSRRYSAFKKYVHIALPTHPTLNELQDLLDPSHRNLTFEDGWRTRAERELASPYLEKVKSVNKADEQLLEAVHRIRNCLAHRSKNATDRMNEALLGLGGHSNES
jgi:hypothetical protein